LKSAFYLILFLFIMAALPSKATHNRAGEIVYKHITGNTYQVTVITYTRRAPGSAISHDIELYWGDGTYSHIQKSDSLNICDSIVKNEFVGTHTYNGPSNYHLCVSDPNRIGGIINIPNSINTKFVVQSDLLMPNPQFLGYNNSIQFFNTAVAFAQKGTLFHYNPNAQDPDGDSLVVQLGVPFMGCDSPVINYTLPAGMTINPVTGEITWPNPNVCGIYNIAFSVYEYRRPNIGQPILVGITKRDMELIVSCRNNSKPIIGPLNDVCIYAGGLAQFNVTATDLNGDLINLTANGQPFTNQVVNLASFPKPNPSSNVISTFTWQTDCNDIRPQFYQLVFNAFDSLPGSGSCDPNFQEDSKTVKLFVQAPPPQNLIATQVQQHVLLTWNNPYSCANNPKFKSFSIFRKIGCNEINFDTCQRGLLNTSYIKIAGNITSYSYSDFGVVKGQNYSYRVVADFEEITSAGWGFNPFSSSPSNEACIALKIDVPIITNVSVLNTDVTNGQIFVRWTKPKALALDTILHPPPYLFQVFHDVNVGNVNTLLTTKSFTAFYQIMNAIDTTFIHSSINTLNLQHFYLIKLMYNNGLDTMGNSDIASSVLLRAAGGDNTITLNWYEQVPWLNDSFIIFKQNKITNVYDSITTIAKHTFEDKNLINDSIYCYFVKSKGRFTVSGIQASTYNYSQKICAIPIDTIATCAPNLNIVNNCSDIQQLPNAVIANQLTWNNPNNSCAKDVIGYNIYYKATKESNYDLLLKLSPASTTSYLHQLNNNSVAGCYIITAIDSFNNESLPSNEVCLDNCPSYILPNSFTPNGDGFNDLFHPFLPYRFIDHIDLKIFNRWGGVVFTSSNPQIDWNGNDIYSGKSVAEGSYFYICEVYEVRVDGIVKRTKPLSGYIEILR
jgi:gliding motility-associated-like protein